MIRFQRIKVTGKTSLSLSILHRSHAYSHVELLIIVAVIGIVSSLALNLSSSELQRARINSVQLQLSGWLQVVQRAALEERNPNGCTLTLNAFSNQNSAIIASVTPASCQPSTPILTLDGTNLGNVTVSTSTSAATLTFTPRGTTLYSSGTQLDYRITISGSSQLRCVRVSDLAGVIQLGSTSSGGTLVADCMSYQRI